MKLTFEYTLKPKSLQKKIIEDILWHCTKVYNTLNYEIKEKIEKPNRKGNINIESSKIYKKYRETNWHSEYLHSHTLQEVIIQVLSDTKSYEKLKEMEEKGEKKLKGNPKPPRYKQKEKMSITFTRYAIREEGKLLKLSLSKKMQEKWKVKSLNFLIPKKLKKLVDFSKIKMIKIKEEKEKLKLEIIYEKEEKEFEGSNIMSIDLGKNNLASCTNANNNESMIVAGESLKSKIGYYDKEIGRLQAIEMQKTGSKKYKNTNRIKKLYEKRNNYIKTYLHKASRMIINYAIENECNTIIVGDIKEIKYQMTGNKSFVKMPVQKLVEKIEYKAKLEGIDIVKEKENYTSGVSSIDKEEVRKENYDKSRRIKRGLFVSNEGKMINADINGSLNIMRKYLKEISPNLEIAMDIGREQRPLKKRVA